MPFEKLGGRQEVSWVHTGVEERTMVLCGDKWNCTIGRVVGDEGTEAGDEEEVGTYEKMFEEGESVDASRFEEGLGDDMFDSGDALSRQAWDLGGEVEDTFRFRRSVAS